MSPASSGLFLSPEVLVGLRDEDRRADGADHYEQGHGSVLFGCCDGASHQSVYPRK
jgi:hypothetical protein